MNHYAPMGAIEVVHSGRMLSHPTMPPLRDVCAGYGRLSRSLVQAPGYLIKEGNGRGMPGTHYVIWDPDLHLPLGLLESRQDARDFGFSERQVLSADQTGVSLRVSKKVDGWWSNKVIAVADWGWIYRRDLVGFTRKVLSHQDQAARAMAMEIVNRPPRKVEVRDSA